MDENEAVSGDIIPPSERQVFKDDDPRDVRALGFDGLTSEERAEMSRRGVLARRANRRAKQLAQLEVFTEAHREMASQILGAKMVILDGLVEEMHDPATGKMDTTRLDERRMKVLLQLIKMLEERAFGGPVTKTETKATVDIRAAVVDLTKALQKPDSV